jgi:hypothetical protein
MSTLQMPIRIPPPPRTMICDTRFHFLGYGIHRSFCRMRVFANGRDIIVVLTQEDANEGTSVTNAVEQIASEMLPYLITHPSKRDIITWIEHYEEHETFDRVTFEKFVERPTATTPFGHFSGPKWQRMQREELEQLVGSDWPQVFPARVNR